MKYKMLIAMDCDGCYEDSMDWKDGSRPGVVTRQTFEYLEKLGAKVIFVSDSPACISGWKTFDHMNTHLADDYVIQRYTALRDARSLANAKFNIYVSDNRDDYIAHLARYTLIHPKHWDKQWPRLAQWLQDFHETFITEPTE